VHQRPAAVVGLRSTDTFADVDSLKAAGSALERLAAVGSDALDRRSSCSGWSVYVPVNMVTGGGHRDLLLMRDVPAEELIPMRTQDHVPQHPLEAYQRWQRPLAAAFTKLGALDRIVHPRAGDRSGLPREDGSPQLALLLQTGRA
jgi:hypothetical protein